jgi:hypothetical protein
MMFNNCLTPCCKEYACDCCLNDDEIINKDINAQLKIMRRQNLHERKLLLLGNNRYYMIIVYISKFLLNFLGNAEAGK